MDWYHKVNPEWLAARKDFLCASDIIKLLPTTATGKKRYNLEGAYLGVWADKQCQVFDNDIVSRGVMARGHILETYAIDEINSQSLITHHIHHWDDALVARNGVSCSPDGLDLEQPAGRTALASAEVQAEYVVEIKAYNAAAHYEGGVVTPPDKLMERWQLATAMYVMPTIAFGKLVFYNPSACHPMFIRTYGRSQLADELEAIEEILNEYTRLADHFRKEFDLSCAALNCRPEADIIAELERLQDLGLNP